MMPFSILSRVFLTLMLLFGYLFPAVAAEKNCLPPDITYADGKLSFSAQNVPMDCLMESVGRATGTALKLWSGGTRKVTLAVDSMDLDSVLKALGTGGNAIAYTRDPGTGEYRIVSAHIMDEKEAGPQHHQPSALKHTQDILPGELLVQFKSNVSTQKIEALHQFLGARVIRQIPNRKIYRIKIAPGTNLQQTAQMYLASGLADTADPNLLRHHHQTAPNDPDFSKQWGLSAIKAPDAWPITSGDPELIIALIDTGVDIYHPDISENIWINQAEAQGQENEDDDQNGYVDDIYGWDMADNDNLPYDMDGHGTHIAGIIGAVTGNGIGISGVCPKVKIMVLKVQPDTGSDMASSDIIEAIEYAKKMGAGIINCSFGGGSSPLTEFNAFNDIYKSNDAIIVASAGNNGVNIDFSPLYPAAYEIPGIISVASSSQTAQGGYTLSGFSNYGKSNTDLMAPGDSIWSTLSGSFITQANLNIAGQDTSFPAQGMTFSQRTGSDGITGMLLDCGYGYPYEIPESIRGNIALIKRGDPEGTGFYFYEKVANAQAAGAAGVVIYNNVAGEFAGTLITPKNWISTISVSLEYGQILLSQLPLEVTVFNILENPSDHYGALSGTSMSAGFVSGAVGLIKAYTDSQISAVQIKTQLMQTVDTMPELTLKLGGPGQMNIFKALSNLSLPGDLNRDFQRDLHDVIIGLKVLSTSDTQNISTNISHWDADENGKVSLPEPIKALQVQK